jgi:hypothetical protein
VYDLPVDRMFQNPVVQDLLRRRIRSLLYTVWYYDKQGSASATERTLLWSAELYLNVDPPGKGFPVLDTPRLKGRSAVRSDTQLMGKCRLCMETGGPLEESVGVLRHAERRRDVVV